MRILSRRRPRIAEPITNALATLDLGTTARVATRDGLARLLLGNAF